MSDYGALLTITKKKGPLAPEDKTVLLRVLGSLDTDEFNDANGDPFNLDLTEAAENQYLIHFTGYHGGGSEKEDAENLAAAKDNDLDLAKEIADVLTSTLGDKFSFKASFGQR